MSVLSVLPMFLSGSILTYVFLLMVMFSVVFLFTGGFTR